MRYRRMALLLAVVLAWVGPLAPRAQEGPVYDPAILAGCLAARGPGMDREACIGLGAEACQGTPGGWSTVGMSNCLNEELQDWDRRLNATYQRLLDEQAAMDADNRTYAPHLPSGVETLRATQRAWMPFRDAACAWEAAQWGGGTGAGPARLACLMGLTARQALFLEARLRR